MVTITFQQPDWNSTRNPGAQSQEQGFEIEALGFDLDFNTLTIYPVADGEMDYNHTLAKRAQYMNEDGYECGEIGWVIQPEQSLLDKMPDLMVHLGKRYGRVIVTGKGE